MNETFTRLFDNSKKRRKLLKKKLSEHKSFIEKLEVKYIEGLDVNTYKKHRTQRLKMIDKIEKTLESQKQVSNPSEFMDFALKMVTKIDAVWYESDILNKRKLQPLVFPEGLTYSKPEGTYLTPRVNSVFSVIDSFRESYNKKTELTAGVNSVYSPLVVRRGVDYIYPIYQ